MEINNIAFEHISGDYYWGKYGEFRVIINIKTGYINVTQLCAQAKTKNGKKKEFCNWNGRQKDELLNEISNSSPGIPGDELLVVVTGGSIVELRGSYAHPDLVPHIASWASTTFAIKVSKIVNEYFIKEAIRERDEAILNRDLTIGQQKSEIGELKSKIDEQTKKIDELLNNTYQMREEIGYMQCSLDTTTEELEKTSIAAENADEQTKLICKKLDIAVERRVPRDPIGPRNEILGIYNKPHTLEYRVIRCQYRARKTSEARCIEQGYTRQVYFKEDPNAVNIFNRIKHQLPAHIGSVSRGYFITLLKGKESEFLHFVSTVEQEKKEV